MEVGSLEAVEQRALSEGLHPIQEEVEVVVKTW